MKTDLEVFSKTEMSVSMSVIGNSEYVQHLEGNFEWQGGGNGEQQPRMLLLLINSCVINDYDSGSSSQNLRSWWWKMNCSLLPLEILRSMPEKVIYLLESLKLILAYLADLKLHFQIAMEN